MKSLIDEMYRQNSFNVFSPVSYISIFTEDHSPMMLKRQVGIYTQRAGRNRGSQLVMDPSDLMISKTCRATRSCMRCIQRTGYLQGRSRQIMPPCTFGTALLHLVIFSGPLVVLTSRLLARIAWIIITKPFLSFAYFLKSFSCRTGVPRWAPSGSHGRHNILGRLLAHGNRSCSVLPIRRLIAESLTRRRLILGPARTRADKGTRAGP